MVAMVAVASPQYAWTLFTLPLAKGLNAKLSDIQIGFTLFVLTQSWLVPLLGYLADRLGSKIVMAGGGFLVGTSWVGSGMTASLSALYFWYSLAGVGVGAVYGVCVGTTIKWFPDIRGLAAGLVVGAYGAGAMLTVVPIQRAIAQSGYAVAFVTWGLIQGLVLLALVWFVADPPPRWRPADWGRARESRAGVAVRQSAASFTPGQMLRTRVFYVMFAMSALVIFGGLVVTAQLKPIAAAYGLDTGIVAFGMNAVALALMVNLVASGLARPSWGFLSDRIGRYRTMALAFGLGAAGIAGLITWGDRAVGFVLFSSLSVLAWGATFVLFAAATGDVFGPRFATTNNGILYASKGVASIFAGWGAARLLEATGSWFPVLWAACICNLLAAILAFFLKPMIARITARPDAGAPSPAAGFPLTGSR